MDAKMRSDKRKIPTLYEYRVLTNQECKALGSHAYILDSYGDIAQVKITSIKTWKTRPDIEVHCKYGMYEYFVVSISPTNQNSELITLV
jgi:hypothetical protein